MKTLSFILGLILLVSGMAIEAGTIRDEWINSEIDTAKSTYVLGSAEFPWKTPAVLFFGTKTNLDGLATEDIWRFEAQMDNDYRFLSNYYPTEIIVDGRVYKSSEHYYQAIKFAVDGPIYQAVVDAPSPAEAKAIARAYNDQASLGDDQEMARRMKRALWPKFATEEGQPNELGLQLLATNARLIVEGNRRIGADGKNYSDQRWGMEFDFTHMPKTATMTGQNLLGKLLMELRDLLNNEKKSEYTAEVDAYALE